MRAFPLRHLRRELGAGAANPARTPNTSSNGALINRERRLKADELLRLIALIAILAAKDPLDMDAPLFSVDQPCAPTCVASALIARRSTECPESATKPSTSHQRLKKVAAS